MKVEKDRYMNQQEKRQKAVPEIISKFEDGEERYQNDPMFNQVINLLADGCEEIKLLDSLLQIYRNNKEQLEQLKIQKIICKCVD